MADAPRRQSWDAIVTTDMLDLATLRGLSPHAARLPVAVYFHENQMMYPSRAPEATQQRDLHFAFTNLTTAAAADAVWFNSDWHRHSLEAAARKWIATMPDFRPMQLIDNLMARAATLSPGVDLIGPPIDKPPAPLQILWVSRWEFDKNPQTFFDALRLLRAAGTEFQVHVLGESFGSKPECFDAAARDLHDNIATWGYAASRDQYQAILRSSHVVVSTAFHEFFGLGVVEAVSAGCQPLVPATLAYPEVLREVPAVFHDNRPESICLRLQEFATRLSQDGRVCAAGKLAAGVNRYAWPNAAKRLDDAIVRCCDNVRRFAKPT